MTQDAQGVPSRAGGPGDDLTLTELAARVGTDEDTVRAYWLALGLPVVEGAERIFTEDDVAALSQILAFAQATGLDESTMTTLVRSTGHTMERLVLWQAEALVGDLVEHHGVDPVTARLKLLDALPRIAPLLEEQLRHAWRRHLATYATRYEVEFSAMRDDGTPVDDLELARAVGFADIVDFTKRTAGYDSVELSQFVQSFEAGARDRIASAGGRVVKTIGDAVLFVADTVATGAEVALRLRESPDEPGAAGVPVRVSLVWGRVLSRFGDVFGPSVNLAARLVDIAEPGSVLMDRATAALLAGEPGLALTAESPREVQGLGVVEPVRLQRAYQG
ncbi:adenylate/guanylate cyclase domain-containing protein [Luteimicrobium subarcticum]|uniref:Adenylate cyclase n=1 Tax=Luteimicrobium subarcticum TaxID=620910 RepID=A0A2M8WUF3_9MICO|nr:adenylate/guanylate cyclase domain-containing protein [Luteimicrobium subarcticum]PJI94562.1 adenylate cyclase [Luteimicrobium subarcticum]